MDIVRINSNNYTAEVNLSRGANCISLKNERYNVSILREPDYSKEIDNPFLYGVPILFPVNRISNGKFEFEGRMYTFPINEPTTNCHLHGLLHTATKGEIENNQVRYLNRENKAVSGDIKTVMSGLLDGFYIDKITFENKTLFEFPFKEARLSEEEIAVAQCLINMSNYIKTGKELYSYERAYEDHIYFG